MTAVAARRRIPRMRTDTLITTGGAGAIFLGLAVLPTVWKPYLVSQLLLLLAIVNLALLWNIVSGYGG